MIFKFVLIQYHIGIIRENLDIQVVVDILDRLSVIDARCRDIAVIINAAFSDHGNNIEPLILIVETDCRFSGQPAPVIGLHHPSVVRHDDITVF